MSPDVQMHPNKFWRAWLGQGGGLKAVWKGFGRSIKMKENFADLIFQNFCSKRPKIDRFCVFLCFGIFQVSGATLAHTTGKNSMRYAFWRVPHTQRSLEACEPAPFTPKTRRLWGKDSIEVQSVKPGRDASCSGKSTRMRQTGAQRSWSDAQMSSV